MTAITGEFEVGRTGRVVEWPSVALCGFVYGGFLGLTWFGRALPEAVLVIAGALLVALHSSMQHEFIHGHPTPWRRLNRALASVPLSLWLPFESYRRSHLVHHCDDRLTDPLDDPESYYWTPEGWATVGPLGRAMLRVHSPLAGRLVFGPAWNIGRYLLVEARALLAGDRQRRGIWLHHGLSVAALLVWTLLICRIGLLPLLAMAYGGTSILLLRSFAEHRASDGVFERTAIVENAWFFGPLFLYNNLHAAHHERPLIPWYRLPAWYKANRTRLLRENGGLVYEGYGAVVRRFLFTPHDAVVHPKHG